MKKEPVVKGVSVLRIPFGSPCTGPQKRFVKDLEEVAYECDKCRNAILRHWIRWHEDHPNYQPIMIIRLQHVCPNCSKTVKIPKNKNVGQNAVCNSCETPFRVTAPIETPTPENPWFPECLISSKSDESLYRKGQQVCPNLAAKIVSSLSQEILEKLKAKTPYNHKGKAKFRGQAILWNEVQADNNASRQIPVPTQDTVLAYAGSFSQNPDKATKSYGTSPCVLRFPLFSKESGRKFLSLICNLQVSQLTPGHKKLLRKICSGEWKLKDSRIMSKPQKRGNKWENDWYFNLTYKQPRGNFGLNKENTATLFANPKTKNRAFQISVNKTIRERFQDMSQGRADSEDLVWQIGNRFYEAEISRLVRRRKSLANRYTTGTRKGHGRKRATLSLRPYSRSGIDAQSMFKWLAIKEIIKFCLKYDCGTVLYREPSLGLRQFNTWFSDQGIPFNWTSFLQGLRHKCNLYGIDVVTARVKKAEFDTIFPSEKAKPAQPGSIAIASEDVVDTHVKTKKFVKGKGRRGHQAAPLATGKIKRRMSVG